MNTLRTFALLTVLAASAPVIHASVAATPSSALAPSSLCPPSARASTSLVEALDSIRADAIRADLYFIASDELGGRDTPSPGQRVAARFIRSRLERLGWQAGAQDGYLYAWSRADVRVLDEQGSGVTLTGPDGEQQLAFARDYFLYSRGVSERDVQGGATFCGTGTKADFDGKQLAGRWAVCFDSDVAWKDRDKLARATGALGLVVVPPAGYKGESYETRFAGDSRRLKQGTSSRRSRNSEETPFSTLYVAPAAVAALAPETWQVGADLGFTLHETCKLDKVVLENVCGLWPGSDPELKNDVIIVSAHYDHVGTNSEGEIYNGADDNGSGTCGLMAIAEALAKHGPLPRTVMLMWVSGEEKGLWGSDAWTKNPWLPEGMRPFCDINIDMIGRNAPDKLLITPTKDHKAYNGLVRIAERVAPLEGFPVLGSADEYWERSDHRNFSVNLKIPVTFLFSDVHEDYHKPTDDPEKIDFDKVRRVSRMVVRMLGEMQAPDVDLN